MELKPICIKGIKVYIEVLEFGAIDKKFITGIDSRDYYGSLNIIINKKWINKIGYDQAVEYITSIIQDKTGKMLSEKLVHQMRKERIIKYVRKLDEERRYKIAVHEAINNILENGGVMSSIKKLNIDGRSRLIVYLNDLLSVDKYRL